MSHEREVLQWSAGPNTGESSKTLAYRAIGLRHSRESHPYDPADLNRCLLLMERLPWVRLYLPEMAKVSPEWAALIEHWDEIEKTFLDEVGLDWSHGKSAKRTYDLMKRVMGRENEPRFSIHVK